MVIMGTGYYVAFSHPDKMKEMSCQEIAEEMIWEIEVGVDGVKAGVIGEIGISEVFNEEERRVLKASAIAHKKTSVGILVHINPWTTNGARLSYEGLPCPNLCTGGENYHGRFEYIPVEDMERCVDMLVGIFTSEMLVK